MWLLSELQSKNATTKETIKAESHLIYHELAFADQWVLFDHTVSARLMYSLHDEYLDEVLSQLRNVPFAVYQSLVLPQVPKALVTYVSKSWEAGIDTFDSSKICFGNIRQSHCMYACKVKRITSTWDEQCLWIKLFVSELYWRIDYSHCGSTVIRLAPADHYFPAILVKVTENRQCNILGIFLV